MNNWSQLFGSVRVMKQLLFKLKWSVITIVSQLRDSLTMSWCVFILVARQTIFGSHTRSGGPSMAAKVAVDGPGDHLECFDSKRYALLMHNEVNNLCILWDMLILTDNVSKQLVCVVLECFDIKRYMLYWCMLPIYIQLWYNIILVSFIVKLWKTKIFISPIHVHTCMHTYIYTYIHTY